MRGGFAVALTLGALLVAAQPAGANPQPFGSSMTVTSSPHSAKAHALRLTVTLRYVMQCGYPGAGPLSVTFPSAVKLPRRFASSAVRLSGKPIAATVKGRRVTVTIPPPTGIVCSVVGPGTVTLSFTRAAKLANPVRAGSYPFKATHRKHAFAAKLRIKPAG